MPELFLERYVGRQELQIKRIVEMKRSVTLLRSRVANSLPCRGAHSRSLHTSTAGNYHLPVISPTTGPHSARPLSQCQCLPPHQDDKPGLNRTASCRALQPSGSHLARQTADYCQARLAPPGTPAALSSAPLGWGLRSS
ncbi:hypothetical protein SKAU_G00058520 [Synaphobranchus kaupii]|uniref:Uncharacterized protein n=1 Tax=Synaphobranchus kaupii TaxID=118154 RepID=A0A9Q1JAI3_SYNKA|nr:hypothetical protein SKAU_G00058520 [Synaphobranchus kaupii]